MIYVKVKDALYPATISGKISDKDWDNRASKSITLEGDYETINALFPDGTAWSIVQDTPKAVTDETGALVLDDEGNPTYTTERTEFDNSDFSIRGNLTVHTNGTCTVKMGKQTTEEDMAAALAALGVE